MKKTLCSVVTGLAVLSFVAVAGAVPASDDMSKSVSVLEGQDQQTPGQPAQPVKRPVKKHKKAPRKHVKKQAPASTSAPARSSGATAPATTPVSK